MLCNGIAQISVRWWEKCYEPTYEFGTVISLRKRELVALVIVFLHFMCCCLWYHGLVFDIWASSRQNLSMGFPTKRDSNQSPQLQGLVRKLNACIKFRYDTFKKANNKGADQSARMRRLVCAFVVRKPPKTSFLAQGPKYA